MEMATKPDRTLKPLWLKKRRQLSDKTHGVSKLITSRNLHSVCHHARCPNLEECYGRGVATFLIMGHRCTRGCGFCQIRPTRVPHPLDPSEPKRVAEVAQALGLRHVVITSVTRDDLEDEGLGHFLETIRLCRTYAPEIRVEVLTPDFHARTDLFQSLCTNPPDVFNHNIETVARLQKSIRPFSSYETSLKTLVLAKQTLPHTTRIKSGMMVGLGETDDEIIELFQKLIDCGVDILTIGQYLQPSLRHTPVSRYVPPDSFEWLKHEGLRMGFKTVFAGPYVRSSYMADTLIDTPDPS